MVVALTEVAKRVELILKVRTPPSGFNLSCHWSLCSQLTFLVFKKNNNNKKQDPKDSLVVLSGCGTSGRMAFLISVS